MASSPRLTVLDGGRSPADSLDDIRHTIDVYAVPAVAELKRMADADDVDGVRALSYEMITLAGTLIAATRVPDALPASIL